MEKTYFLDKIPVKRFSPEGDVRFAVLAVHGFGGSKNSGAIALLAEKLCPLGGEVFAYDHPAHGENTMGAEYLVTAGGVKVMLAVAAHMKAECPGVPCGVFATSYGGYVALNASDKLTALLGEGFPLVLRAPAVHMGHSLKRVLEGTAHGQFDVKAAGAEKLMGGGVPEAFVADLIKNDAVRPFDVNAIVLHGTADEVVPRSEIEEFLAFNPGVRLCSIEGTDHRFTREGSLDEAIDCAVSFFTSEFAK